MSSAPTDIFVITFVRLVLLFSDDDQHKGVSYLIRSYLGLRHYILIASIVMSGLVNSTMPLPNSKSNNL